MKYSRRIPSMQRAVFEEDIRESIRKGKLSDVDGIDKNLLQIDPKQILDMNIEMTVVGK